MEFNVYERYIIFRLDNEKEELISGKNNDILHDNPDITGNANAAGEKANTDI
jgi:hypothetical protein